MEQFSFSTLAYDNKKVITKRECFFNEMEQVVPWSRLLKIIKPYYPKTGMGRPPIVMKTMLRIYFLQQWYALSDPAASFTKNKNKQRDPDMKSTRKNYQYFFGMKIHIGTDVNNNAIHSATVTSANKAQPIMRDGTV